MKYKKQRNLRKHNIHTTRYGMDAVAWAKYQKEHPQEAHIKRMKVQNPH